jgi:hypothetical protein
MSTDFGPGWLTAPGYLLALLLLLGSPFLRWSFALFRCAHVIGMWLLTDFDKQALSPSGCPNIWRELT